MATTHATTLPNLDRVQQLGLGAAAVGLLACGAGFAMNPDQFYRSYLTGFLLCAGLPLGCLGLLMLHHMVGGEWGMVMRRILEAGTRTFPFLLILLAPVLLNLPALYKWAKPGIMDHDAILKQKELYLNAPFFVGRILFYFAVWIGLSTILNRLSAAQEAGVEDIKRRLNNVSAPGTLVSVICVTFAAFDLAMSLDPHWFSTIFGLIFLVGTALSALSLVAISLTLMRNHAPMNALLKPSHFHDIGNLMFAFTVLWAYMNFSQFLIIWSGNLPEEIPWFIHRLDTSWGQLAMVLVTLHFVLPFFLLLLRVNKKKAESLTKIAVVILVARLLEIIWVVQPNFEPEHLSLHWLDLAAPVGLVGLWLALFARELKKRPLVPVEAASIKPIEHH
jgi:hypothetical protein